MMKYIGAPDRTLPADPAECCSLTMAEQMLVLRIKPACSFESRPKCQTVVNVGLFFDGTNNNMERDYKKPPPARRSHSNIVRLHNAYPDEEGNTPEKDDYFYRVYMPGVGTPFPQIGETGENTFGRAFAAGGQARILWGVLQVYNAVHRAAFQNAPLLTDDDIASKIKDYENCVDHQQRPDPESPPLQRKDWFAPLTQELSAKLRAKLDAKRQPEIPFVSLSVFGFSRGAVEARAFCYWFQDVLHDGKFAGIATEIRFLGLFDSVATVGTSDSMHQSLGLPRWLSSGHSGWAAEILKPLPSLVKKTVHYIAAHEQRMNFPVTRVFGENVEEVLYPGTHSDVGGGYGAGDQGKARKGLSSLMAQIPLLHMYKAALLAGVPLTQYKDMEERVKVDVEVDPELIQVWDQYMQWCGCKGGLFIQQLALHYACYFQWRAWLLGRLEQRPFYLAANAQDRADLKESNDRLKADLTLVRYRAAPFRSPYGGPNPILLSSDERTGANLMQVRSAQAGKALTGFETAALRYFDHPVAPPSGGPLLFEDYMHDSLAGFYMAGAVTELDRRTMIENVCKKHAAKQPLNGFEQKIYQENQIWIDRRVVPPGVNEGPNCQAEIGAVFPVQTDADVGDLREWVIVSQTDSRREGGGYLRDRAIFGNL